MSSKDSVVELLNELKIAESIADPDLLINTINKLSELGEQAADAIPSLLSLYMSNYDVPKFRNALKTAFTKIGYDISKFEPLGKIRLLTRLLLLFALIQLNGTLFGWGAADFHPFNYIRFAESGPMLLELLNENQVVFSQGNYYWFLTTFLVTAIYYSFYFGFMLYQSRKFPSGFSTIRKTSFGLLFPLLGLILGVLYIDQTLETWIALISKIAYQQILVLGFLSFSWGIFLNIQYTNFLHGLLHGTSLSQTTSLSSLHNDS